MPSDLHLVQYFGDLQNIMEQNKKIREDMQLCNRGQKDISKLVGCKMIAGSCMLTIYWRQSIKNELWHTQTKLLNEMYSDA